MKDILNCFKQSNDSLESLGVGIDHVLTTVCRVGENGEQASTTCKYLNGNKDGYFCLKLVPGWKNSIDSNDGFGMKGDYCEDIDTSISLGKHGVFK